MWRIKNLARKPASVCIILYILTFILYASVQGSFALSPFGISVLLNNSMSLALVAAALTFVVLTGGFDLSVAGTVALSNSILASLALDGISGAVGDLFLVCLVGTFVGLLNGICVAYLKLQSVAVTLGTMLITSGIALLVLHAPGGQVSSFITDPLTALIGPIPAAAIILVLVGAVLWFILTYTKFGVSIFAIGQDRTAARTCGIPVERVELGAYIASGIVAGLSGFMMSAETGTGDPSYNPSFLLLAFASVAIGGTSFRGGRGSIIGSIFGAGLLVLIQKMLFAFGVSSFVTGIFEGGLMVAAVLIGTFSLKLSAHRSTKPKGFLPLSRQGS